jgi:hypothetical protein
MIYGIYTSAVSAATLAALFLGRMHYAGAIGGVTSRKLDVIEGCSEDNWGNVTRAPFKYDLPSI